jgi:serine/threonine protein phosphatase PrpC
LEIAINKYSYKRTYSEVRGYLHIRNNLPCQDKTYYLKNNGLHIMVLADGAGSAKHSDVGAKEAVKCVANHINDSFDNIFKNLNKKFIKDRMIQLIIKRIEKIKPKRNSVKDYASTLLFIATHKDKYILGHLGDGAIGLKRGKKIRLLSAPENGETENSTFFYTSDSAVNRLRLKKGVLNQDSTFVLMSDGSFECIYDKQSQKFTNALYSFIDWTKKEDEKKVSAAILKNIKNHFTEKTTDDISLSILDINVSK